MADFKKGDVVMLKSGGPPMTVQSICSDGNLSCTWFIKGEQKKNDFDPETVKIFKLQAPTVIRV